MTSRCSDDIGAFHALVRGRVQGVGFRFFVQNQAEALGVDDWVRNCGDGSVEVQGQGPRPKLESLLEALRLGPVASRVDDVEHEWLLLREKGAGFKVIG